MAQCVCVSSEWGFAAPDTVISSSRMYFLSRWRCGGRWNGGVCAGGERRPTIQAYQTSSATIRLVTQDPRARSHTHACAHAQTQKCTQTAGPCLIDRWLSPTNRRLGSTSMPPPPFLFFFHLTHACVVYSATYGCVCVRENIPE